MMEYQVLWLFQRAAMPMCTVVPSGRQLVSFWCPVAADIFLTDGFFSHSSPFLYSAFRVH